MSQTKQHLTIKDQLLMILDEKLTAQNKKGMNTYGQTLDDCPVESYNWTEMALEESIDMNQYLLKENRRLRALLNGAESNE